MDDLDAYGNKLPKGTRQQINKERALYNRIARQMQREVQEVNSGVPHK